MSGGELDSVPGFDLAVALRGADEVLVIHGMVGAMPRRTTHPARRPVALAALDSNGDGKLELVMANQDSDEFSLIDGDAP